MIACEKFDQEHFDELACAIMALENASGKNLTCEDLQDISNHCYLLRNMEDSNILALIAGKRTVLDEEYIGESNRHTIQYLITDFAYDPILTLLEYPNPDNIDSLLTNLVREFCVDMNAWSVKYMIPNSEDEDEHIKRALRTNGFVKHNSGNYYLRVITAIDFNKNH